MSRRSSPWDCHLDVRKLHCYACSLSFSDLQSFKFHHHNSLLNHPSSSSATPLSSNTSPRNKRVKIDQKKRETETSPQQQQQQQLQLIVMETENSSKCLQADDGIQVYCIKCCGTFHSLKKFLIHLKPNKQSECQMDYDSDNNNIDFDSKKVGQVTTTTTTISPKKKKIPAITTTTTDTIIPEIPEVEENLKIEKVASLVIKQEDDDYNSESEYIIPSPASPPSPARINSNENSIDHLAESDDDYHDDNDDDKDESSCSDYEPEENLTSRRAKTRNNNNNKNNSKKSIPRKRTSKRKKDDEDFLGVIGGVECPSCSKGFSTTTALKRHIKAGQVQPSIVASTTVDGDAENSCTLCDLTFELRCGYRKHLRDHKNRSEACFKCKICSKVFGELAVLKRHEIVHTGKKRKFPCTEPDCDRSFKSFTLMARHKIMVHAPGKRKYKCDFEDCPCRFRTLSELRKHSLKHDEKEAEGDKSGVPLKAFACDWPDCTKSYDQERQLKRHKYDIHEERVREVVEKTDGPFICKDKTEEGKICGKVFKARRYLLDHRRIHRGDDMVCNHEGCGKKFNTSNGFRLHKKLHVRGGELCTVCGKLFLSSANLRQHIKIVHEGRKEYLCSHCGRSFGDASILNRHIRTHTNERPFKCTLCPSAFTQKIGLDNHMKSHLGIKEHPCSFCGRKFSQKTTQLRHEQIHTGEKPFKCEFPGCGAAFPDHRPWKKHKLTHQQTNNASSDADNDQGEDELTVSNDMQFPI